ncbi:MAG TPA: response regulator [Acidimicrobiia bacterium]|jgi:DNA-binding response OmpR family regulator
MPLVLVVDDEPDIRTVIQINLQQAGYRVVMAANGEEALAALRAEPPDAVLLDVMMPGVDGWSVLQELKTSGSRKLAEIPVFLVTAISDNEQRIRGGIEGAVRYITKPFDPNDLLRALASVLDPDGLPEPQLRRRVQAESLEALARAERGEADPGIPRVRLTRLEQLPAAPSTPARLRAAAERVDDLTPKQRKLLEQLASGMSVTAVAAELGMSRSNVYAGLRRIGRKLGLQGTNELLAFVRQGRMLGQR